MIARYNGVRTVPTVREAMDRFFENAIPDVARGAWSVQWGRDSVVGPVNVFEDADAYRIQMLLPGVKPEEISVTAQPGGLLTIASELMPTIPENARPVWAEWGKRSFRRDVQLPLAFDPDQAQVEYVNGVLHITLPKAPESKPKQLKIGTSNS